MTDVSRQDRYTFPAVLTAITKEGHIGVAVEIPDLPRCLVCGDDKATALAMAKEAMGLELFILEGNGDDIPTPTPAEKLVLRDDQSVEMLTVDMVPVRQKIRAQNDAVEVTLSLPRFVVEWAEENEIDLSRLLCDVLDAMRVGKIDF